MEYKTYDWLNYDKLDWSELSANKSSIDLLKKYPEYFPEEIELKLLVPGGKLIYAEPILPSPPISILKEVLETVKLTKLEKERNELNSEPIVYSPK
jgi:hypothetical protein